MTLPKAVQAQVDEVNRLQAAMSAPEETATQDPPVEQETQEPVQAELPLEEPQIPEETWEHKYRSEVGRYKAETERAREAAQQAWDQFNQLRQEVEQIKQARDEKPEPPKAPEPEIPGVTDQDVESFGSELVDFAQRAAAKVAAEQAKLLRLEIQALHKAMDELRGQVGNTENRLQKTAEQSYYEKLASLVPDWQQVNTDQAFLDWLGEEEGVTGYPRQAFLAQAHQQQDATRVARIFEAFKSTHGAPPPAPKPSQSPELQKQVSPPKARAGSSAPVQQDKKIWTEADITAFYEAKARGKLDATEAARMEADLNSAVAEGRVR